MGRTPASSSVNSACLSGRRCANLFTLSFTQLILDSRSSKFPCSADVRTRSTRFSSCNCCCRSVCAPSSAASTSRSATTHINSLFCVAVSARWLRFFLVRPGIAPRNGLLVIWLRRGVLFGSSFSQKLTLEFGDALNVQSEYVAKQSAQPHLIRVCFGRRQGENSGDADHPRLRPPITVADPPQITKPSMIKQKIQLNIWAM